MKIIQHLSAIAIITIIMGLVYAGIQQTYRSNANDPQIQVAHDLRDYLLKGKPISFDDTTELDGSLSVFKETYDGNGSPIQSTGFLNGRMPQLPKGVLESAKTGGENRVTWQPQAHLRMAMVIVSVKAAPIAYVAVGRSLHEVEERLSGLTKMVFISWILCICIVLLSWIVAYYNYKKGLA